jgi:hypothetical protein
VIKPMRWRWTERAMHIAGYTYSNDFPVVGPLQAANNAAGRGADNAFISVLKWHVALERAEEAVGLHPGGITSRSKSRDPRIRAPVQSQKATQHLG